MSEPAVQFCSQLHHVVLFMAASHTLNPLTRLMRLVAAVISGSDIKFRMYPFAMWVRIGQYDRGDLRSVL